VGIKPSTRKMKQPRSRAGQITAYVMAINSIAYLFIFVEGFYLRPFLRIL
jgi:hypothetical protein